MDDVAVHLLLASLSQGPFKYNAAHLHKEFKKMLLIPLNFIFNT